MKEKVLVLVSGGLDSVVNLSLACRDGGVFGILHFRYGQKASASELRAVKALAAHYSLRLFVLDLSWLSGLDQGLTQGRIPDYDPARLDDHEYALSTAAAVWVPNRNGLFINAAGAYADRYGLERIVVGFNAEEAATFPDNTEEYMRRATAALEYSSRARPQVFSYTSSLDKAAIVEAGYGAHTPFRHIWSCYRSGARMCGICESCRRLKRALYKSGRFEEYRAVHPRAFSDWGL